MPPRNGDGNAVGAEPVETAQRSMEDSWGSGEPWNDKSNR